MNSNTLKPILISLLIITGKIGFAQNDTIYNSEGEILEIGTLIDNNKVGDWIEYYDNGIIRAKGAYKDNKRSGTWYWYHDNGKLCSREKFKNGDYSKGEFWNKDGQPSDVTEILVKPVYPEGMDAFRDMIAQNLVYPEDARKNGIQGSVHVEFNINSKGELVDSRITRSVHSDLDIEALRVIRLSGLWKPGTLHEKPVKVSFTFPVVFTLTKNN